MAHNGSQHEAEKENDTHPSLAEQSFARTRPSAKSISLDGEEPKNTKQTSSRLSEKNFGFQRQQRDVATQRRHLNLNSMDVPNSTRRDRQGGGLRHGEDNTEADAASLAPSEAPSKFFSVSKTRVPGNATLSNGLTNSNTRTNKPLPFVQSKVRGTLAASTTRVSRNATLSNGLIDCASSIPNTGALSPGKGNSTCFTTSTDAKGGGETTTQRKDRSSLQGQNARNRALKSIAKRNRQCATFVEKELKEADAELGYEVSEKTSIVSVADTFRKDLLSHPVIAEHGGKMPEKERNLLVPSTPSPTSTDASDVSPYSDSASTMLKVDSTQLLYRDGSAHHTTSSSVQHLKSAFSQCSIDAPPTPEGTIVTEESSYSCCTTPSIESCRPRNAGDRPLTQCKPEARATRHHNDQKHDSAACRPVKLSEKGVSKHIKSPDALPLSVQRVKERDMDFDPASHRTEQETRRNLDKRSARLKYSQHFKHDIQAHLKVQAKKGQRIKEEMRRAEDTTIGDIYDSKEVASAGGVAIFVRKRPIFSYELARNDFDVVSLGTDTIPSFLGSRSGIGTSIRIHNCHMHADMRRMMVQPTTYPSTLAFDETCSNEVVYETVAHPLVQNVTNHGAISTILMFGQTGSGKTYTMSSIELHASHNIFAAVEEMTNSSKSPSVTVSLQFIELAGKVCRDMITSNPKGNANVKIVDDENGRARIMKARKKVVNSPEELTALIALGKSRRATEATDANGVSSRSHAVCQIEVRVKATDGEERRGVLNLLDCAGTERRNDSLYHSASRQKESTEINASLYALKECIRARTRRESKSPYVPYRSSNLTRLLRESFEREDAKLCVIATVSPNATDTEHSMETLKTVASIAGSSNLVSAEKSRIVEPAGLPKRNIGRSTKQMSHDQLVEWMQKKNIPHDGIGDAIDGKALFKLSAKMLCSQCFRGDAKLAEEVFKKVRNENDIVEKLQRNARKAMKDAH
jgi:kinesin family protein 2/24